MCYSLTHRNATSSQTVKNRKPSINWEAVLVWIVYPICAIALIVNELMGWN